MPKERPGLRDGEAHADRIEHEVNVASGGAQRTNEQLVIGQQAAGTDQPPLEAADAADVAQIKFGPRVAQRLCDGQRGVDVPAGSAARHQTPHQQWILSAWSRG